MRNNNICHGVSVKLYLNSQISHLFSISEPTPELHLIFHKILINFCYNEAVLSTFFGLSNQCGGQ